jgi:tetratricopeptide (TPR) repeat protein
MNDIRDSFKGKAIDNFRNFEGTHGVDRIKALAEWGLLDEALNVADACIVLQENMDNARFNRGVVFAQMGRYVEAIADFEAVINYRNAHKRPSDHLEPALSSRGLCNLALGNLVQGFLDYEPRRRHLLEAPKGISYTGEQKLRGKTVFVVGEPTLTENLIFCRYLPLLHADICLAVPPAMQILFQFFPGIRLAVRAIGYFDYWCTLMSLASAHGTTIDTIPFSSKFNLPIDQTIRWRPDLGLLQSRRIGLCWSGPECKGEIPLALLSFLFELEGVEIYSFQDEVSESDRKAFDDFDIWNMGSKFKNFIDAACALKSMDLLITVDNAIAHLAATLGIPCWVLLPKYRTHWIWGSKKNLCPWYPSVRIFRQFNDGDWTSVVTEVHKALIEFCRL